MPRVLNLKCDPIPPDAVYIGRGKGSIWGNDYIIGKHGNREEVIEKFTINQLPKLLPKIHMLRNKDLLCFCAPKACHGDVLLTMANVSFYENIPNGFNILSEQENWPYVSGCTNFLNGTNPCFEGINFLNGKNPYFEDIRLRFRSIILDENINCKVYKKYEDEEQFRNVEYIYSSYEKNELFFIQHEYISNKAGRHLYYFYEFIYKEKRALIGKIISLNSTDGSVISIHCYEANKNDYNDLYIMIKLFF